MSIGSIFSQPIHIVMQFHLSDDPYNSHLVCWPDGVCGSFFQYTIDEGLTTDANPIRSVKQESNFKQRNTVISPGKALTPLQWNYVIETAEVMAAEDPRHEPTLFIVATLSLPPNL